MRASSKRILSIGLAALLLIGALLVYANLIQPTGEVIKERRGLLESKNLLLAVERGAIEQVQSLIGQFQNIQAAEDSVLLAVPVDEDVLGAIRQIDSASKISGVNLVSLGFGIESMPPPPQPFLRRMGALNISLRAEGGYVNLKGFLERLEQSIRVANIRNFNFSPGGLDSPDILNLDIRMFYQE